MPRLYNKHLYHGTTKDLYPFPFQMASNTKALATYKKSGPDSVEIKANFALDLKRIKAYNKPVKILTNEVASKERYRHNSGAYKIYVKGNYLCFNGTSSTPLEDYLEIKPIYLFKINSKTVRDSLIRGTDVYCNNILLPYMELDEIFKLIQTDLLNGFKIRKNNKIYYNPSPIILNKTSVMLSLFSASPKPEGLSNIYIDIYIRSPIK